MTSIRLLLLQAVLCVTLVYGRSRWPDPPQETIYVSKITTSQKTMYRLTETRLAGTEWNQITGENRASGEFSFFKAYSRKFEEEEIGPWYDTEYIGGFTRKMRVCKLRHSSSGQDMYILTVENCENFAASGRIGEEFNFYVASSEKSRYSTSRIYYASCQDGNGYSYVKVSRNSVRCGSDSALNHGSFYAHIPEASACEYLSAPQGTTVSYQYEQGRITGARLSCNPGYEINGNSQITCGSSGRWMGTPRMCEPTTCGDPTLPDRRMTVETPGPYSYNDWVKYKCPNGYEVFPPEASANCQSNGRWFAQHAECRPVDCRFPGEPRFGSTIADNGYQLGAEISFECNNGYRMEGSSWAVCTDAGKWEPSELPTCHEVRCPSLPQPENGRLHGPDSRFVMGQEVIFQCDSGYSLVGDQILKCEFNEELQTGVWSARLPVCSQIRCQPLTAPENGKIIGSDYSYGAQISFECNPGYTMRGADVATCQNNGRWDAQSPTCHVMQCRDPGIPEHSVRQGNSFTFESVLTYQCDVGYIRHGAATLVCGQSGRWTSKPPTCEPVGCPELMAPQSGSKEGDTFSFGSKVQFSCFPGYKLIGANETECLSSSKWSEDMPECQPCPLGQYKSVAGTGGCTECPQRSYTTSEASTSRKQCICEQDTHGPAGGPCEAVKCTYPAAPEHGQVKECGVENNDLCVFSCDPGYILQGSRSRTCTPRGWTGHLPVCVACPPNMYKRDEGSLSCTPCPQGTYIPEGSLGLSADLCQCRPGFQRGSQGECEDINECAVNNGGCEDFCENTPGSFKCKCTKGGWELNADGRTCFENQTCSALDDIPEGGATTCTRQEDTNGVFCRIKCHAGYFFVSGMNNYVTCGPETNFEYSHKLVNRTARLPACTREYFVDILLPVRAHYESQFSCNSLEFSPDMFFEQMRVQQFIGTLYPCIDTSNSGRFCEARNLTLECKDVTGDDGTTKSQITVGFDVLLKNKEDGAIHPSCVDQCKRQNLRGMLGNAINLTKEMEELLKDKAIGIDTGNGNPTPVTNTGVDRTRPKMFCIAPGRVLTRTYLCVPCDKGYYLPNREMEQCLPCPKGTYQDEQSQTSCKPCLPGSTTLTDGTPSPHMCNIQVTDYLVNSTNTQTELNMGGNEEDSDDVDLDSFAVAF